MSPKQAPFGTWKSAIAAADLAQAAIGMSELKVRGGASYWRESRPSEGGRQIIMRRSAAGQIESLTPNGFNVRTRVNEYGGASFEVIDDSLLFVNFSDQRVYLQKPGAAPMPITAAGFQFADFHYDATRKKVLALREDHRAQTLAEHGEERHEIVWLDPFDHRGDQNGSVLVSGADFYAEMALSPDAMQLAYLSWQHPHMPWDQTELTLARLKPDGSLQQRTVVAGSARTAPLEPCFTDSGDLLFIDDPNGWWQLQRLNSGTTKATRIGEINEREFGGPLWNVGQRSYVQLDEHTVIARHSFAGFDRIARIDLNSNQVHDFEIPDSEIPWVSFSDMALSTDHQGNTRVLMLASSSTANPAILALDPSNGAFEIVHQPVKNSLAERLISKPQLLKFPTRPDAQGNARDAYAFFYPPHNPDFAASASEKPPLLVFIHGGPTGVTRPSLSLARQYWTSRGFAVVDVNYGGSTTLGRAYRERLHEQWGVVDVQDATAAVDYLIASAKVDPKRIAIRGGSAGGFTTLAALAFTDRFNAGANYYGVSDIAALAATSHKFERNYDVSLVGKPDPARYRERSPIYHLDGFKEPLISFQGDEDKVVPPEQSRAIVEALDARGIAHAYIEFKGEQHGFRKAENIIRAQEAELYFYGKILGFEPADTIETVDIKHLKAPVN